jgi:polysaccharide export outer membrane protein
MRTIPGSVHSLLAFALTVSVAATAHAQSAGPPSGSANGRSAAPSPATTTVAPGYVIGPDDVLTISLWKEPELSGEYPVLPDGRISLLLVNEVQAAGQTIDQLREFLNKAYEPFIDAPNVSVRVKEINSRQVFITGNVPKPGPYKLPASLTLAQLVSIAGGLLDYADQKDIVIIRAERDGSGQPISLHVNYEEIAKGRHLVQNNVELKPGDTVIVR